MVMVMVMMIVLYLATHDVGDEIKAKRGMILCKERI
jgi:hypothetical protein